MNLKIKLVTIFSLFLLVCNFQEAEAQDPRYSQFYASSIETNPAMGGIFDGRLRAMAHYRDQWSSVLGSFPFRTYSASVEMRFNTANNDFLTAGGYIMRDEVGEERFNQNRAVLNLSYQKQIAGGYGADHFMVIGAQFGGVQTGIDWSKLKYSTQFDYGSGYYNELLPTLEAESTDNRTFVDLSVGLMWYTLIDDDFSVHFGGALFHVNTPTFSFYGNDDEKLNARWLVNGGAQIPLTDRLSVLPAFMVMQQGGAFEADFGTNIRFSNGDWDEVAVRAGLFGRIVKNISDDNQASTLGTESIVVSGMLEYTTWLLGISYDLNVSNLSTATNNRGAFELSLGYILEHEYIHEMYCPKF